MTIVQVFKKYVFKNHMRRLLFLIGLSAHCLGYFIFGILFLIILLKRINCEHRNEKLFFLSYSFFWIKFFFLMCKEKLPNNHVKTIKHDFIIFEFCHFFVIPKITILKSLNLHRICNLILNWRWRIFIFNVGVFIDILDIPVFKSWKM